MRLLRLNLHGFKTFADKTEVTFAPGLTAVVGPNGSGKSNIADAVLWALGEQKTSNLRASRPQDVIFAGSQKRKPTGVAEVTLTFDNEDGALPLKFAQVSVTRRIYRSGEGEYFINKTACRLKDITDLFLDTGVGRDAYAIVNQSEIDAVLSARPEERRELFEEAAGVKRYRARRREAQRKMENTEVNLLRVGDILSELETQREPARQQAERTRRHDELTPALRQIEVAQLAHEWRRLSTEQNAQQAAAESATREHRAIVDREAVRDDEATRLQNELADVETLLEAARRRVGEQQRQQGEARNAVLLSQERAAGARRDLENVERDNGTQTAEVEQDAADAKAHKEAVETARQLLEARQAERQKAEHAAQDADRQLRDLTQQIIGLEAGELAARRRIESLQNERAGVEKRILNRARDLGAARARVAEAEKAAIAAQQNADAAARSVADAHATYKSAEARQAASLTPAQDARADVAVLFEQRNVLEREMYASAARLRALEETEAAREGYFAGVRAVLRAAEQKLLPDGARYQTVADAITVPGYLDTAVEVALGGSLQDIITQTQANAKAAIAFLNETRGGRATFLPLDGLRSADVPDALRRAADASEGVLGAGADLVGYDPDISAAVRVLLARVLFVETLGDATTASRALSGGWAKIVTLGGEVVVPSGAITGGTTQQVGRQGANLLGRKREIGELGDALAQKRDNLARLAQDEVRAGESARLAEDEAMNALADLNAMREAWNQAQRRAQTDGAQAERLARNVELLGERLQTLQNTDAADAERLTQINLSLETTAGEVGDGTQQTERGGLLAQQRDLSDAREAAQKQLRDIESDIARIRERVANNQREGERSVQAAERARATIAHTTNRAMQARTRIGEEEARQARQQTILQVAETALADAQKETEDRQREQAELRARQTALQTQMREAQRQAQTLQEAIQQARLKAARLDGQLEAIRERLLSTYDLAPDDESLNVPRAEAMPIGKETAQEIARLRRALREIGDVNPQAIEEWETLQERVNFLTDQRDDLNGARAQLLDAITSLDGETTTVFLETFRAVEIAFRDRFRQLFGPDGETQLVLTQPDNILETGIEILAQPPGKKRQNLALLSGGERALTATALLFAFLTVRPAPFCILDEVDAPLDGANVEKFAVMLKGLADSGTQCIVITHNATTMEAAPLWFGVTMQEPGVSRALSMRAPEHTDTTTDADTEIAVANSIAISVNIEAPERPPK